MQPAWDQLRRPAFLTGFLVGADLALFAAGLALQDAGIATAWPMILRVLGIAFLGGLACGWVARGMPFRVVVASALVTFLAGAVVRVLALGLDAAMDAASSAVFRGLVFCAFGWVAHRFRASRNADALDADLGLPPAPPKA